jgi:hypothetical protein
MRSSDRAVTREDTLRLRWLTAVVIVMAALTVGWPVVNLAVPNRQALAAGTMLRLGPGKADLARFTVGSGWSMVPSQTDPRLDYSLRHGAVDMTVSYVAVIDGVPPAQLWAGLQKVIQISNPGVHLGPSSTYKTAQGRIGDEGILSSRGETGIASVIRDSSGTFAVEMILIGPRHGSRANFAAAHRIMHSLQIPAPRR